MRAHDAGKQAFAARFRSHGAHADVERRIPELFDLYPDGGIREAKMDLTLHFPASPGRLLVDFTIHVAPQPVPGQEYDVRPGSFVFVCAVRGSTAVGSEPDAGGAMRVGVLTSRSRLQWWMVVGCGGGAVGRCCANASS